jgi:hypothetical protein
MPNQPLNYSDAIDTVFGMINAAWANANQIVGYTPEIRWQGREVPAKPPIDKIWARVSAQIVTDEQTSLANVSGQKLYHAKALLYIQLFCPRTDNDLSVARIFSQYIQGIFLTGASADGNVWFTNPRIMELVPNATSYPIMISVNFEYDHLSDQTAGVPAIVSMISRGKHFPVEAVDGLRSSFTFVGLPVDPNFYLIFLAGVAQDSFAQNGQTIDFGVIIPAGTSLYGLW